MISCLAAVLPLLFMALIFNYSLIFSGSYFWGISQEIMGYIVQAEFLAAATGILIICPLLVPAKSKYLKYCLFALFIAFSSVVSWTAYNIGGMVGMFFFAALVFVTYGGGSLFIFDWLFGTTRTFLSLLRWSMAIFVYFSLQLHYDLNSDINDWKDTTAVIHFGASLFYLLMAFELILYPPLSYYLENKLKQDTLMDSAIAINQKGKTR